MDELEHSLTGILEQRATDKAHLDLVREACRKSVADFVRKWLISQEQWRRDRFAAIIVVFPDETPATSDEDLSRLSAAPTLRLNDK